MSGTPTFPTTQSSFFPGISISSDTISDLNAAAASTLAAASTATAASMSAVSMVNAAAAAASASLANYENKANKNVANGYQGLDSLGHIANAALTGGSVSGADLSTSTFIFTGLSAPRILRDRMGDIPTVKDCGAKGDGTTDDTAALQAAFSLASSQSASLYAPAGAYMVDGNLTIPPALRFRGAGRTSGDGGYAQFGTQIIGRGGAGGTPLMKSSTGLACSRVLLADMTITAAATSSYSKAIETHGLANSTILNVLFQANNASSQGAAAFLNDNTIDTTNPQNFPPVWSNTFAHLQFGTVAGKPLVNQSTDSRFVDIYLSGGVGSTEAGLNNDWLGLMVDHASGTGLIVAPSISAATVLFRLTGGNFQICGQAGLSFSGSSFSSPQNFTAQVSNVGFNNLGSTATGIYFGNALRVSLTNIACDTSMSSHITFAGSSDKIIGGFCQFPKGLVGIPTNSSFPTTTNILS